MRVISDSTPLIHLAKIGKIYLLEKLFEEIIIAKEVHREVIEKGKELNKSEIKIIEKLIDENFINIKEAKEKIELPNLHKGEKETLSLCRELKINSLLIDDKEGFNIAVMLNLTPIRTTSILIILLDKKIINFNEYKESLKNLSESGYFLDAITYEKLLDIGKGL